LLPFKIPYALESTTVNGSPERGEHRNPQQSNLQEGAGTELVRQVIDIVHAEIMPRIVVGITVVERRRLNGQSEPGMLEFVVSVEVQEPSVGNVVLGVAPCVGAPAPSSWWYGARRRRSGRYSWNLLTTKSP